MLSMALMDLMSPRHEMVRARTAKLFERLACHPEGHHRVLALMLTRVNAPEAYPYTCAEFYAVLCHLLTSNPAHTPVRALLVHQCCMCWRPMTGA